MVAQHFSVGTVHVAAGFHIIGSPTLSPCPHRLRPTPMSRLRQGMGPNSPQFPVLGPRSSWVLGSLRGGGGGHLWEWAGSGEFSMEVGG